MTGATRRGMIAGTFDRQNKTDLAGGELERD